MMSACALILFVLPTAAQSQSRSDIGAQPTRRLSTIPNDRQALRFLESHEWLRSPRSPVAVKRQLRLGPLSLARLRAERRSASPPRATTRSLALLKPASPRTVICRVFGDRCREALAVSRCESRLRTDAQNGQYLGLFQMGSDARRLFGHGSTAVAQAEAAHRYFVASGRDWGPWSCKPWS